MAAIRGITDRIPDKMVRMVIPPIMVRMVKTARVRDKETVKARAMDRVRDKETVRARVKAMVREPVKVVAVAVEKEAVVIPMIM